MRSVSMPHISPGSPSTDRLKRLSLLITLAALAVIGVACGGGSDGGAGGTGTNSYVRVVETDAVYSIEDVRGVGYKTVKTYDVDGLVDATEAYYGFWQPASENEPVDYEVRVYPSHALAIASGTAQADEVTGDDAVLDHSDSSWPEGLRERRWVVGGSSTGGSVARYPDYVIVGNLVVLCQGRNTEHSQERCNTLVSALP